MAIQRLNYFNGQFLRETDFKVEQGYHLSMRRSHNQRSHTPGIVHGLEVVAGTSQVVVKAGMAIDHDGREILVEVDTTVPIGVVGNNTYVVIALDERKTDKAVDPDPIHTETRWTESPVFDVVAAIPAGAVGLAQITSMATNGTVTLNDTYRRIYSAPTVNGDLAVGRDLTVFGNLEVKGQTTQIDTDQMRGNVVLGDADTDTVTVEGKLLTGHSSGALQIGAPTVVTGSLSVMGASGHLTVQGNTVLGDADADTITIKGAVATGHSSGRLKISSPIDVTGDIVVSGNVDGRDVSADGTKLDTHAASTTNPHATTAAQVDAQGGTNRLVAQINAGTGVIADARIDTAIARETRFNTSTGHDHDGSNSRKIAPGNLQGVNTSVTAAALNALTGGPTSNASAYHTHPFVPADGSVSLSKLEQNTRARMLKVPLLAQSLYSTSRNFSIGNLYGIAFDGTYVWVANPNSSSTILKIDLSANAVVNTVTVGSTPFALAFGGGFLWVANWGSNTVSKIDASTSAIVATISVGSAPNALAVSGSFLWVANYYSNTVSKIDMSTNTVVATVPVGASPAGLAVVGAFVWVANNSSNNVSKIDTTSNTVVATVSVGSQPMGLAATTATFLWVANSGANTVSKIDVGSNTVVATLTVASGASALAVIGNFLWAGGSGQVQKFDTTTNASVATVAAPTAYWGNSMTSVSGSLWVSGGVQVTKIDATANTISATILPMESRGMAFDGLNLWVALYGCGQVLKIEVNTGQVMATVPVGLRPHSVAYNGTHVFVTNFGSNSVSKIDPSTATVVATIPVGANPAGIAFNPYYGTLWVVNSGAGTASTFYSYSTSVEGTVTVGTNPQAIACESYFVWITNAGSNTVTRLGGWVGGTLYNTVNVSAAPQTSVFDYTNLWVITTGTNSLTKIATGSATATTVALPAGAVPAKMCFNGTHVLVLCTNQQLYKVDIYTNAVTALPVGGIFGAAANGVLSYDGVFTWAVDSSQATLYSAML